MEYSKEVSLVDHYGKMTNSQIDDLNNRLAEYRQRGEIQDPEYVDQVIDLIDVMAQDDTFHTTDVLAEQEVAELKAKNPATLALEEQNRMDRAGAWVNEVRSLQRTSSMEVFERNIHALAHEVETSTDLLDDWEFGVWALK